MRTFLPFTISLSVLFLFFLAACDTTEVEEGDLRTNLPAPTLLRPATSQTMPASLAFEWTPVADAASYELELDSASPAGMSLVFTVASAYHATLETAGDYSWRVRAIDARGRAGYWSRRSHLSVLPR